MKCVRTIHGGRVLKMPDSEAAEMVRSGVFNYCDENGVKLAHETADERKKGAQV